MTRTPGPAQQIRTVPSVTDCQAETRLAAAAAPSQAFQVQLEVTVGLRLRLQPGPPVESLAATGNGSRDTRRLRHPSLGVMPVMTVTGTVTRTPVSLSLSLDSESRSAHRRAVMHWDGGRGPVPPAPGRCPGQPSLNRIWILARYDVVRVRTMSYVHPTTSYVRRTTSDSISYVRHRTYDITYDIARTTSYV